MQTVSIYQDLFDHNDWANQRIGRLCDGLSDSVLDQPREMGFGSLRNTVFHILEAEKLWLERWQNVPWRPLQADALGMSLADMCAEQAQLATTRNELLHHERANNYTRLVTFRDLQEREWSFPIGSLLNHVSNHGIHHRAQALNMLRSAERKVPGGLDYLFWKLSRPSCPQRTDSLEPLRAYGLEVASAEGHAPELDAKAVSEYFAYSDWGTDKLITIAASLDQPQLDSKFEMGLGSLRKNLQHIIDAERWWVDNWKSGQASFPRGEAPREPEEMRQLFTDVASQRNDFVRDLNSETAARVVEVTAGGPVSRFRVLESMLQLCGHATHHRAQCVNMLRQLGVESPAVDMIVWLRDQSNSHQDVKS